MKLADLTAVSPILLNAMPLRVSPFVKPGTVLLDRRRLVLTFHSIEELRSFAFWQAVHPRLAQLADEADAAWRIASGRDR